MTRASCGASRRVLLLQPTVGEWDELRTKPSAPLALLHAATLVAREFDVRIFDRRLHKGHWREALAAELSSPPLLVGATGFTGPMLKSSIEMCKVVRALHPHTPIVWGGIHASLMPEQTVRSGYADYVVQGEGEVPLLDLARALAEGRDPVGTPGVWSIRDGQVCGGTPQKWVNLDELPDPPWHLINVADYLPEYRGRKSFFFQSSRGCPLACSYCYNVKFNTRRWRRLSAERVVAQVHHLVERYGVEDVYFVDDMFFTDLRRARAIAAGLRPLGITWQVQGVDILGLKRMTDDDYQLWIDSGCTRLTVGIESGSPRIREYVKKDGTVEDVIEVTRRLASYPITLFYSFICGLPTETDSDLRQTVDLVFRLLAINPRVRISPFYIFTPYPGTEMFQIALEHGMKAPESLEEWADFRHENANLFPEKRRFYEALYFTSFFLDRKADDYAASTWMRWLSSAYRPIARYRTRHFQFAGLVEKRAMDVVMGRLGSGGRNARAKKPLTAQ